MKISSNPIQSIVRDTPKPNITRAQNGDAGKPVKTADQGAQKATPPGLERALARLQSLPERNAGQANAMDRIGQNIARYTETQALKTPTPVISEVAPTVTAEPEVTVSESVVAPVETSAIATEATEPAPV